MQLDPVPARLDEGSPRGEKLRLVVAVRGRRRRAGGDAEPALFVFVFVARLLLRSSQEVGRRGLGARARATQVRLLGRPRGPRALARLLALVVHDLVDHHAPERGRGGQPPGLRLRGRGGVRGGVRERAGREREREDAHQAPAEARRRARERSRSHGSICAGGGRDAARRGV